MIQKYLLRRSFSQQVRALLDDGGQDVVAVDEAEAEEEAQRPAHLAHQAVQVVEVGLRKINVFIHRWADRGGG